MRHVPVDLAFFASNTTTMASDSQANAKRKRQAREKLAKRALKTYEASLKTEGKPAAKKTEA